MVWNTGYTIAWDKQHKDPVEEEGPAVEIKFLVGVRGYVHMQICNSHEGSQVKHTNIFMHSELPALLIAVDDDGRVYQCYIV